jgi:hypothetical protein
MYIDGRPHGRNPTAARNRNIDTIRDNVGETVACQRGDQAQRSAWNPVSDFQEILIDFRRIRPAIKASPDLLE